MRDTEQAEFEAPFVATLREAGIDPDTLVVDETGTLRPAPREGDAVIELPSLERDQLKILDRLGEGGFGVVERAVQVPLGREVAVKRATAETATEDLVVEARTTGHLEHPNVIPVHALGRGPDGEVLLVMKRIEGRSWRALLEDEPNELGRHLDILIEVCRAVHFAHERGVLHRDLKPDNVMVGPFGEVYVLDWGIAVGLDQNAPEILAGPETGEVIGTPGFMAPEMCEPGAKLDRRTDVYALGAILFRVLTGRRPHCQAAVRAIQVLARTIMQPHADPGDAAPAELRAVCRRATDRDPAARFASAENLQSALERYRALAATLRLVDEAVSRVDHLERLTDDERDDVEATRAYYEARFGLEQALREWPGLQAAGSALTRAHLAMIRRELDRGRSDNAEQIANELDELPPELASALTAEVSKRKKIESLVVDLDPRLGERGRRFMLAVLVLVSGGLFTVVGALQALGHLEITPLRLLVFNLVGLGAYTLAALYRRVWRENKASRMLALSAFWIWIGVVGIVIVFIRFGGPTGVFAAMVSLLISVGLGVMATTDRRFSVTSFVFAAGTLAIFAAPAWGLMVNGICTVVGFGFLALQLNRAPVGTSGIRD